MAIVRNLFVLVCVTLSVATMAQAKVSFQDLNTNHLNQDFVLDNEQFRGTWRDRRDWDGVLCQGSYEYTVKVQGKNEAIDLDVRDDNTLAITADLRDLYFHADGVYQSGFSACLPVGGWIGIGADRVVIKGTAVLGQSDLQDIKIKITGTEFGTIHMGRWVPSWFEDFATDLTNRALKRVWASRLGEWLSAKASEVLKSKLPFTQS